MKILPPLFSPAFFTALLLLTACSVRFNMHGGGAVNPDLKSISIQTFPNEAPTVVPYLGQLFTQKLQDRFLAQSRLTLTDASPSVELTGAVTSYTVAPTALQGNATASQNRLTVGIRVTYKNNVATNESWEKNFSAFTDYSTTQDLSAIERDKLTEIVEQLTQQVFNESLGKW